MMKPWLNLSILPPWNVNRSDLLSFLPLEQIALNTLNSQVATDKELNSFWSVEQPVRTKQ